MGKIEELLEKEAKAAETADLSTDLSSPLPEGSSITRGHPRAKNLQVRFRDDEFEQLTAYADTMGLPVSTVVRLLVMKAIAPADDLRTTLDRIETDLAAVRHKALSA